MREHDSMEDCMQTGRGNRTRLHGTRQDFCRLERERQKPDMQIKVADSRGGTEETTRENRKPGRLAG